MGRTLRSPRICLPPAEARSLERRRLTYWLLGLLIWFGAGWAWAQKERVLARSRSPFNELQVLQVGHERVLKVRQGGSFVEESRCDMRRPAALCHQYSRLQLLASLYPQRLERALVVGLGGASLSKALLAHYPQLAVDSIELDPEIVQLARRYFGYREDARCKTLIGDGRTLLQASQERYDIVFLDAFDGLEIPPPLRTQEFYALVREHLRPGGVVVSNLHRRSHHYDRDRVTLASVFPESVGFQGTGLVVVLSSLQVLTPVSGRWSQGWGFEAGPLLRLRESEADFDRSASPFQDSSENQQGSFNFLTE